MQTKTCTGCSSELPITEYHASKHCRYGVAPRCKPCEKVRRREKYLANPSAAIQQGRNWYHNNLDRARKYQRDYARRNRLKSLVGGARQRARAKGLPFNLDASKMTIPELCPVFGTPLVGGLNGHPEHNSPSLDRLDPEKGYTMDNVVIISMLANRIKQDATSDQVAAVARWMEEQGL